MPTLATLSLPKAGLVAALLFLLSLGVFVIFKIFPMGADVPLLKTPDWEGKFLNQFSGEQLLLRRESEHSGALLLKRSDIETVYRYDSQKQKVDTVTVAEWERAGGPIAKCGDQRVFWAAPSALHLDDQKRRLFVRQGEREVSTAGGVPLNYQTSPSGKWVAVLSASGPKVPSFMPLSGDVVLGPRYHQVMSLPDTVPFGSAVRVPVLSPTQVVDLCWSADEGFVVYTHPNFFSLVVVETGLHSPNK